MRKLYLVPILHTRADMGSMGQMLDEMARARLGQDTWQRHREAVSAFWDCIARYFDALDVTGIKIYQDGMLADGVDGLRIIKDGISRGSRNHEIVGKMLERGAVLMKTEDPELAKQEYSYLKKIADSRTAKEKEAWALRYRLAQDRLLKERDTFIARRINETLGPEETGILFIGAYHDILPGLSADIQVIQVKEVAKVREYYASLLMPGKDHGA